MKWIKYFPEDDDRSVSGVTYGKVYEVLVYNSQREPIFDSVIIINDYGVKGDYFLISYYDKVLFIDVTAEYRDRTIDDILN